MTTSGTSTFNYNRDQIIKAALRKIGAIAAGETPNAQLVQDAADALNSMVKHWGALGVRVWTIAEGVLFPQAEQVRYALATTSTDHATLSYVGTELTADAATSATALTVDAITGISNADHLGIVLDDGTLFWTTVNGAPSGTTVTAASGLTSAAASGNKVFAYTSKLVRPLKIIDVRTYNLESERDTPLDGPLAHLDYQALPNKSQTGQIVDTFYDPQLSTGYLYLWQPPATLTDLVKFTHHRPIEDFSAAGNTPDLPAEWIQTLIFNLAVQMAPEFDVPSEKLAAVAALAGQYLDEARGFGREAESIMFGVDMAG